MKKRKAEGGEVRVEKKRIIDEVPSKDEIVRDDTSLAIEQAILQLTTERGTAKTICPSEIPRLQLNLPGWRGYMPLTREVALKLAKLGEIDILQKGDVLDVSHYCEESDLKGPIRLRMKKK